MRKWLLAALRESGAGGDGSQHGAALRAGEATADELRALAAPLEAGAKVRETSHNETRCSIRNPKPKIQNPKPSPSKHFTELEGWQLYERPRHAEQEKRGADLRHAAAVHQRHHKSARSQKHTANNLRVSRF